MLFVQWASENVKPLFQNHWNSFEFTQGQVKILHVQTKTLLCPGLVGMLSSFFNKVLTHGASVFIVEETSCIHGIKKSPIVLNGSSLNDSVSEWFVFILFVSLFLFT